MIKFYITIYQIVITPIVLLFRKFYGQTALNLLRKRYYFNFWLLLSRKRDWINTTFVRYIARSIHQSFSSCIIHQHIIFHLLWRKFLSQIINLMSENVQAWDFLREAEVDRRTCLCMMDYQYLSIVDLERRAVIAWDCDVFAQISV